MSSAIQVLLVEDSPDDVLRAREALAESRFSFELTHAPRLSDAVELLRAHCFDIALLDLGLLDSQGLPTLLKLRASHPEVPIVVMTGTDIDRIGLLAVRSGAQDYLVKGRFGGDVLGRTICYAIERHQSRRSLHDQSALASLSADIGAAFTNNLAQQPLQVCADAMVGRLAVLFAGIWTLDASKQVLELQGSAGSPGEASWAPHRVQVGEGRIGRIAAEKKPQQFNALRGQEGDAAAGYGVESLAFTAYPLMMGQEVMGVLALYTRRPLTKLARETLSTLSGHIALGLDRSRTEQARQREEAKWKAITESKLLGVAIWSAEGGILDANDTLLQKLGYSREELEAGQLRWREITPPEYRQLDELSLQEVRHTGRSTPYEKEVVRKDGSRMPILIGRAVLRGADGEGIAFILDRTEINKSEEANYTLQAIMEGADLAIIGISLEGNIVAWNPGATRLYGYRLDEVLGNHVSMIVPPERVGELEQILQRVCDGERAVSVETVRARNTGHRIDVSVSFSPVRNKEGRVIAVIKIDQDISEKRHLEAQFRQSQKMEAVGQLAAGVAHDFNNLLTVINGFSEVLGNDPRLDAEGRSLVGEIQKAGQRGESLTRQLLAFSRKTVLAPQILNLNEVIRNSVRMLQRIVGEDIEIITRLDEKLDSIQIDPHQIEHAIVNLTLNARDAMPQGGQLRLETGVQQLEPGQLPPSKLQPGRYVTLSISDTGSGMSEETTARIFEPFFTTKEIGKGTGLGLPAVGGIIEQSGGAISVSSELGRGTTFTLFLPPTAEPLAAPRPTSLDPTLGPQKHPGRGNEWVLLVEDDDAVRMIARVALQRHGYTVIQADHGEEAIAQWQQYRDQIQLLVTDVVMPGINGRELVERLRTEAPAIKVLYLSGYNEDAIVRHTVLEGTAFLQKPFNSSALAAKVREILDQ